MSIRPAERRADACGTGTGYGWGTIDHGASITPRRSDRPPERRREGSVMSSPNQQFAEAVRRSQAAAAEVVQAWASITTSAAGAITPGRLTSGDGDSGNDPSALIDQAFDFAARMLADQRDLVKRLVQLSGQLADKAGSETASSVAPVLSGARDRVSSAADSVAGTTQAAFGAARGRAEDARQAAIDATDVMLQTARQGADAMFEAAKNQLPLLTPESQDATSAAERARSAAPAADESASAARPSRPAPSDSRSKSSSGAAKSASGSNEVGGAAPRRSRAASPARRCRRTTTRWARRSCRRCSSRTDCRSRATSRNCASGCARTMPADRAEVTTDVRNPEEAVDKPPQDPEEGLRGGAAAPADRAGHHAAVGQGHRLSGGGDLRGPGRGGQGFGDQADHRVPQSPDRADRRPAGAHRAGARPVVLPALHPAPAGGRRDRADGSLLVQPRRRRAGDGVLHARTSTGASCIRRRSSSGCSSRTASCCASTGSRCRTSSRSGDSEVPAHRSHAAMEAVPDGRPVDHPLGGLLQGQGRDVRAHRHSRGPVVHGGE